MLDAAPNAAVIVDGESTIAYVNDLAGELFGYGVDALLGQQVDVLLPEAQRSIHRAHRARYRAAPTPRVMGAGLDLWAQRADGTRFPVEIRLSPLKLGDDVFVVAFVQDITERLAVEDQLHRILRTLDASDDGVFIFDAATLQYSYVNAGAVRLAGYGQEELLTMTPLHLNPYTLEAEYRDLIESLRAPDAVSVVREATLMRKDGTEVAVETTLWLAPKGRDGTNWVITLTRDITTRLAAEAKLRHSQGALRSAEQVVAVAEDRERIARDLHDTVIQRLFGEGLNLQAALVGLDGPAAARVRSTIEGLDQTIKQLRMAIFSLQGADAAPGGLRGRIVDVIADATAALGFDPGLEFDGAIETIDDLVADHLVAVLREALSNVARHAAARSAQVAIRVTGDVLLTVTDDGRGPDDSGPSGNGLGNMAERAERLGGAFTLIALPGGGSVLTWRVPTSMAATAAAPT